MEEGKHWGGGGVDCGGAQCFALYFLKALELGRFLGPVECPCSHVVVGLQMFVFEAPQTCMVAGFSPIIITINSAPSLRAREPMRRRLTGER